MSVLAEHQKEALEQAYDLLKEHFDASLLVVTAVVMDGDEEREATQIYWAGGYMQALGHSDYARYKIRQARDIRESAPGDQN
jgi:hypothetical protein